MKKYVICAITLLLFLILYGCNRKDNLDNNQASYDIRPSSASEEVDSLAQEKDMSPEKNMSPEKEASLMNEESPVERPLKDEYIDNNIDQPDSNIDYAAIYNEFLKSYDSKGKEYYYSILTLDSFDYPILLLSDGVYKDFDGQDVSIYAEVHYLINNKVTFFGNVHSLGTAYPISSDTYTIYSGGGHVASKYTLDIQNIKLKMISSYMECFFEEGDRIITEYYKTTDEGEKTVSKDEFDKAIDEYLNAKPIPFTPISN